MVAHEIAPHAPGSFALTFEIQSTSPDGRYQLQVAPWEARNTHWVLSPRLLDLRTEEVVFKPMALAWSADSSTWLGDVQLRISLRKYPGDQPRPCLVVDVDCLHATARIDGGDSIALGELEAALERALGMPK
jgi:hypothetical protein